MKTTPLVCTKCQRAAAVARSIADFWTHDSGVAYICPRCLAPRINDAVFAAQQNKADAIHNVYQTLKNFARL